MSKHRALSEGDYGSLLAFQEAQCAVCSKRPGPFDKALAVDHDHLTGEVRGLLCGACNYALGWLHEDKTWLAAASQYLEVVPARGCWGDDPRWWPGSPGAAGHDLRTGL